ncbi:MAG: hypothetical protein CMF13_02980 [Idiomarina sp.]|nr:hypothetical protein [Idiomarina sp.]
MDLSEGRRSYTISRGTTKIGDNLCGGDDSCDQHVMQLRHREKYGGREGTRVNSKKREMPVVAVFLSSRSEPHPDQSELC